jgi:hypothetical protein
MLRAVVPLGRPGGWLRPGPAPTAGPATRRRSPSHDAAAATNHDEPSDGGLRTEAVTLLKPATVTAGDRRVGRVAALVTVTRTVTAASPGWVPSPGVQ